MWDGFRGTGVRESAGTLLAACDHGYVIAGVLTVYMPSVQTVVSRLERGDRPVPERVARLALLFEADGVPADWTAPPTNDPSANRENAR